MLNCQCLIATFSFWSTDPFYYPTQVAYLYMDPNFYFYKMGILVFTNIWCWRYMQSEQNHLEIKKSRTGYEACGYSFVFLFCTWPRTALGVLHISLCSHMARMQSEKTNDGIGALCDLGFFLLCGLIFLPFTSNTGIFFKL